jgi:hypothetical protein
MEGQDQGGVRGGLGPGHAVVRAGEEVLRAMPGVVERDVGEQVHIHSKAELDEEGDQQAESPAPRGAIPAVPPHALLVRYRGRIISCGGWFPAAGFGGCPSAPDNAGEVSHGRPLGWWLACSCVAVSIVAGTGGTVAGGASLMPSQWWRWCGDTAPGAARRCQRPMTIMEVPATWMSAGQSEARRACLKPTDIVDI